MNSAGKTKRQYVAASGCRSDDKMAVDTEDSGALPFVSVVVPSFNEENYITKLIENLLTQYDPERLEIIIVDGMSTDRTREHIERLIAEHTHPLIRLVDNPKRNIPTALNPGIESAGGELIVRMDAHSIPSRNYVRHVVKLLSEGRAEVVGMPWQIVPGANTLAARAIALAVSHPFGIGDAKYRLKTRQPEFVDTVPFGAFRKELWREMNGFNEEMLANEDYDFSYRARTAGNRVLLDPTEHSIYHARSTLQDLGKQYARYGNWKAQMVKQFPRSIKLRQIAAPALVLSVLILPFLGLIWPLAMWTLFGILLSYATLALTSAVRLTSNKNSPDIKENRLGLVCSIIASFVVIHLTWGTSFLVGLARLRR